MRSIRLCDGLGQLCWLFSFSKDDKSQPDFEKAVALDKDPVRTRRTATRWAGSTQHASYDKASSNPKPCREP